MREFEAVIAALRTTNVRLHDSCIRLFSDNTGVVYILKNKYSSNELLRAKLKEILTLCCLYKCSITATHLPGE
jgi:hypothetical protein